LTLGGATLYGMTYIGGSNNGGEIFAVNTDGSDFSVLHSFLGGNTDGIFPQGSLTLSDGILYGMTSEGGSSDLGAIFSVNTDGSDYTILHSFTGIDGATPYGDLMIDGSTLYGMTTVGGSGGGVIFSLTVPEPSSFSLLSLGVLSFLGRRRRAQRDRC
jgi:uncharacterized repeat protein (TIGR03803 family)